MYKIEQRKTIGGKKTWMVWATDNGQVMGLCPSRDAARKRKAKLESEFPETASKGL